MNTKIIKTETSLDLNLEFFLCFLFFIFFILLYFIYMFLLSFFFIAIFIPFIIYFQSSLCLSNAFSAYG
jgi:hypothetical protein